MYFYDHDMIPFFLRYFNTLFARRRVGMEGGEIGKIGGKRKIRRVKERNSYQGREVAVREWKLDRGGSLKGVEVGRRGSSWKRVEVGQGRKLEGSASWPGEGSSWKQVEVGRGVG
jgi:hypothetical protein